MRTTYSMKRAKKTSNTRKGQRAVSLFSYNKYSVFSNKPEYMMDQVYQEQMRKIKSGIRRKQKEILSPHVGYTVNKAVNDFLQKIQTKIETANDV
jgi:hypothetical protein